jgi:hypothetical protein
MSGLYDQIGAIVDQETRRGIRKTCRCSELFYHDAGVWKGLAKLI